MILTGIKTKGINNSTKEFVKIEARVFLINVYAANQIFINPLNFYNKQYRFIKWMNYQGGSRKFIEVIHQMEKQRIIAC